MPNFLRVTNKRTGDLLPGEQVVAACGFASKKAVDRYALGAAGPDTGANIGAVASPVGAIVGGLLAAAATGIGLGRFMQLTDDDLLTTGMIELPYFVMAGVTDRALLFWRYEPGAMSHALVKELHYRVPFQAVRSATARREKDGWFVAIEFVDGATFAAPVPPAYVRRARHLVTALERATTSRPATPVALDWERFRAPPPPPKPPPTRPARAAAGLGLAVLIVLLAVCAVVALRDPGGPAPRAQAHFVSGTVTVSEFSVAATTPSGLSCAGTGVASGIAENTEITITDDTGTVLASAVLHAGVPLGSDGQEVSAAANVRPGSSVAATTETSACRFAFSTTGQVHDAPEYRFVVGGRAPRTFTSAELEMQGWKVSLWM